MENDLTLLSMFIIHINTRSSYHMLYLLILNNFASWTNAVNQIVN